ncbi:MAG: HlyD family type I secretion periplasmic adaptor subunit [Pseudomonadota bacterium]
MLTFLSHHWAVLKAAWSEENERAKTKRVYRQEEFLPAALEILEKPPSPIGRLMAWTIMAFFALAVIWSIFGRVDVVAAAPGKTLPLERVKVVQASEVGVVRAIHVLDGMRVQLGDPLIDLDPTQAAADRAQANEQLAIARIDLARGEAILAFLDGDQAHFDQEGVDEKIAQRQQALIDAQVAEYVAQRETLERQRDERLADIAVANSQASKLRDMLPMVREQLTAREALTEQGFGARLVLLEARERHVAMQQDLLIAQDETIKAEAALSAVARQIDQYTEEFRKTVLADLAEAEANARLAEEDLNKASQRFALQSLASPVDGVVQQLSVHTIGGVVQPAQELMMVVPGDGDLVVEALLANKDFGFVTEGDVAEVKLEAFPFTKYGVIDGRVEIISNDAIQDENLGLVYQVRVTLDRQTIMVEGREVRLSAGMAATAEIKTGKRRIIEFLLSPLLRYRDEALRER